MTWDGLRGDGVTHSPSAVDSSRFGREMGRVVVGVDTTDAPSVAAELTRTLRQAPEEVLIVRWPSALIGLGAAATASGRAIIAADVLTYWGASPGDFRETPGNVPGLEIVAAPHADTATRAVVADIVTSSFQDYASHYAANPLLDQKLALAGYVEWALSCLAGPGRDVLLLTRDRQPVGLAALEAGSDGDLEILLCGLAAEAQGLGLYQRLLHGIAGFAQERGHRRVIISTQAHNVRAQRVWARTGLLPFAALTTVHAVKTDGRNGWWK